MEHPAELVFFRRYNVFLPCGFDAADAEARCLGQVWLMDKLLACLHTSPPQQALTRLEQALAEGRLQAAFAEAHQLKGLAGSLAMQTAYRQASELCCLLREQQSPSPEQAALLRQLTASWQQLLEALQAYETQYPSTVC